MSIRGGNSSIAIIAKNTNLTPLVVDKILKYHGKIMLTLREISSSSKGVAYYLLDI